MVGTIGCLLVQKEFVVRTTINLDEELLDQAQRLLGVTERSAVLKEALIALIQRESARRLILPGGTQIELQDISRRRGTTK